MNFAGENIRGNNESSSNMSYQGPTKTDFTDEWRDKAACFKAVAQDPSLVTAWDNIDSVVTGLSDEDPNADIARRMCFACPVRMECLEDAMSDNEAEGIRGGYRFISGTVTKETASKMYRELKLRPKVRRKTSDVEILEM